MLQGSIFHRNLTGFCDGWSLLYPSRMWNRIGAMSEPLLMQLTRNLEWLGCELEYQGKKHAHEGFPKAGATWEGFVHMQKGVDSTIDKLERELTGSIKYNPASLVGVDYPLAEALDAIGLQLGALEDIRNCAEYSVDELPAKVRGFTRMVETYLAALGQQDSGKQPARSR